MRGKDGGLKGVFVDAPVIICGQSYTNLYKCFPAKKKGDGIIDKLWRLSTGDAGILFVEVALVDASERRRIIRVPVLPSAMTASELGRWAVQSMILSGGAPRGGAMREFLPPGVCRIIYANGDVHDLVRVRRIPCTFVIPCTGFDGLPGVTSHELIRVSSHGTFERHVVRTPEDAPGTTYGSSSVSVTEIASGLHSHGEVGITSLLSRGVMCVDAMRLMNDALASATKRKPPPDISDPFGRPPPARTGAMFAAILYTVACVMAEKIRDTLDGKNINDTLRGVHWFTRESVTPPLATLRVFNLPAPAGATAAHLRAAADQAALEIAADTAGRRRVKGARDLALVGLEARFHRVLVRALVDPRPLMEEISTTNNALHAWIALTTPTLRWWIGGLRPSAETVASVFPYGDGRCFGTTTAILETWLYALDYLSAYVFEPRTIAYSLLTVRVAPCVSGIGSVLDGAVVMQGDGPPGTWETASVVTSITQTDSDHGSVSTIAGNDGIAERGYRACKRAPPASGPSLAEIGKGPDTTPHADMVCELLGRRYFAILPLTEVDIALPLGVTMCSVTGAQLDWSEDQTVALRYANGDAVQGWGGSSTCIATSIACAHRQGLFRSGVVLDEELRIMWASREDVETLRDCVMPPMHDARATVHALRGGHARVRMGARRLLLGAIVQPPRAARMADVRTLVFGAYEHSSGSEGPHTAGRDHMVISDCESLVLGSTIDFEAFVPYATRIGDSVVLRPDDEMVAGWVRDAVRALDVLCPDVCPEESWASVAVVPPGVQCSLRVPSVQRFLLAVLEPLQSHFIDERHLAQVGHFMSHIQANIEAAVSDYAERLAAESTDEEARPVYTEARRLSHVVLDVACVMALPIMIATGDNPGPDIELYYHKHEYGEGSDVEEEAADDTWEIEEQQRRFGMPEDREATLASQEMRKRREKLAKKRRYNRDSRRPEDRSRPGRELMRAGIAPRGYGTFRSKTAFWRRIDVSTPPGAVPMPAYVLSGDTPGVPVAVRIARSVYACVSLARMFRRRTERQWLSLADDLCAFAWVLLLSLGVVPRVRPPAATDTSTTWCPPHTYKMDATPRFMPPTHVAFYDDADKTARGKGPAAKPQDMPNRSHMMFLTPARAPVCVPTHPASGLEHFFVALRTTADTGTTEERSYSMPMCLPAVNVHPHTGLQRGDELLEASAPRPVRTDSNTGTTEASLLRVGHCIEVKSVDSALRQNSLPGIVAGHAIGVPVPRWMRRHASAHVYTSLSTRNADVGEILEPLPIGTCPWNGCDPMLLRGAILNRSWHLGPVLSSEDDVANLYTTARRVLDECSASSSVGEM